MRFADPWHDVGKMQKSVQFYYCQQLQLSGWSAGAASDNPAQLQTEWMNGELNPLWKIMLDLD